MGINQVGTSKVRNETKPNQLIETKRKRTKRNKKSESVSFRFDFFSHFTGTRNQVHYVLNDKQFDRTQTILMCVSVAKGDCYFLSESCYDTMI